MKLTATLLIALMTLPLAAQQYHSGHTTDATIRAGVKGLGHDSLGNLYVGGGFEGTINLLSSGVDNLTSADDAYFLAKLAPNGSVIWKRSVSAAAPNYVGIESVLVTDSGGTFVTGGFQGSVDFEPSSGNHVLQSRDYGGAPGSGPSSFILKYDADGNIVWSRQLDGGMNIARQSSLGPNGELFVSGMMSNGVDLDPGPGQFLAVGSGILASYLLALDANGDFLWAHNYEGGVGATLMDAAADASGNVYVCGLTNGTLYLSTEPGTPSIQPTGTVDSFCIKYDPQGTRQWLRHWGAAGELGQVANDVCVDPAGCAVITGSFRSSVDFDNGPGDATLTATSGDDAFVLKLLPNGDLAWAKGLGATEYVQPPRVDADPTGIYVGGHVPIAPVSGNTTFIAKLDSAGTQLWSQKLVQSPGVFGVFCLSVGPGGRIAIGGHFNGTLRFTGGASDSTSVPDAWWLQLDQTALHAPIDFSPGTVSPTTEGDAATLTFTPTAGSGIGYTWQLDSGTLPPGLSAGFGTTPTLTLSGVTHTVGTFQFGIRLTDDLGNTTTRQFNWQVNPVPLDGGDGSSSEGSGGCVAGNDPNAPVWTLLIALSLTTLLYRRTQA